MENAAAGASGGPFRRKPFRRTTTTPYDRPASAARNPIEGGKNLWISKLVDPASRIITNSAQRFFSSVFRKSLPAPETVPEANRESRDRSTQVVSINLSSREKEQVNSGDDNPSNRSDSNEINEIEQILKQKTFSRAEFDHLTELLRSRTVDVEPSTSEPVAADDKQKFASILVQENEMGSRRLLGGISEPAASSSVLEENVASPAELAKAYMGNRHSKGLPSTLGLHGPAFKDDIALVSDVPFPPKSPNVPSALGSVVRFAGVYGVSENGYRTPRPRGKSAIYSMARTPYSRTHLTVAHKSVGSAIDGTPGSSTSSRLTWENNTRSGGKQVAKRRSSVFDNDIGSIGPIRRIRQKTNLISPSKSTSLLDPGRPLSIPRTVGSDASQFSMHLNQKPLLLNERKNNISEPRFSENGDNDIPSSSVPPQSSEMARKILLQLDKLVPSPKEKSSELKLAIAREKSPAKLTHIMLHGQALRSVENVESSKLLVHNTLGVINLDGAGDTSSRSAQHSTQKQNKVAENGPNKIAVFGDQLAPEANGLESTVLIEDSEPTVKTKYSAISNSLVNPPEKKRAFKMSAHEDSLELDDDSYINRGASTPLAAENGKLVTPVMESKVMASETVTTEKPPVSSFETRPSKGFILNKDTDTGASNGHIFAENNTGFTFSVTPAASTITQSATFAPQSPSYFDKAISPKELPTAPVLGFGHRSVDKAPPFTFSSMSSGVRESSTPTFGAWQESELETSKSSATVAATVTETIPKTSEPVKDDKGDTQKVGDLFRKPESAVSSSVSTSTTPSIFSFGATNNSSSLNNGSLTSTPSIFSVPTTPLVPVFSSSKNQTFADGSSITTTTVTSSSSLSMSATSTFTVSPTFTFGSNASTAVAPSSSIVPPSTPSGTASTNLESETKQASPFGSLTSSPFAATSSQFTSTGSSSIFGFGASAPSSTMNSSSSANNHSPVSNPFSATPGSLFGAQTAPAGTGVTPFTQSMPSQFSSSALSSTFGSSGSSTFNSGSSMFGSSTPGAKLFGSSSGFGTSSSTTFSINSFSSGSGSTSLFGSSLQPATSSMFGSAFASTSSTATGFSFGGSSAAVPGTGTGTGSAQIAFSASSVASSGPIFSFSSADAMTSSALLPSSHTIFGTPNPVTFGSASPGNDQMNMEDSMAEDTVQASAPAVLAFGQPATLPTPSGFTFGSPAPSGVPFQFGSQQNPVTPQNPSPFQATANLDFSGGGSFSLGTGGGDKSNRRIVRPSRSKMRKK